MHGRVEIYVGRSKDSKYAWERGDMLGSKDSRGYIKIHNYHINFNRKNFFCVRQMVFFFTSLI